MSEDNKSPKPKIEKREILALEQESSKKIDGWIDQINSKKKINLSRRALLNWLIETRSESLSSGEINTIIDKFYDEEAFLRQLLRDVKKAKLEGQIGPSHDLIVRPKKSDQKKDSVNIVEKRGDEELDQDINRTSDD